MEEKKGKKEAPVEKLEQEFRDFQIEWKKFLTNDFQHLANDVGTLVQQNAVMQKNMSEMEKKILKALGAQAYDYVKNEAPNKTNKS